MKRERERERERERAQEQRRERGDPCSTTAAPLPPKNSAAATDIHHRHRRRRPCLWSPKSWTGEKGLPLLLLLLCSFIVPFLPVMAVGFATAPTFISLLIRVTMVAAKVIWNCGCGCHCDELGEKGFKAFNYVDCE
ncbi:uncharacterized protein LOC107637552 isoform X4 [Arachis ipaensis]|uniref:uncharacterized protein LOC107637552 isoform X4 n=1 Tax=Arachis ipaensis TaxID=130454 RepID=UPI000A2B54A3|nr:uncharacterized protein LOC107637552 isoform X4 [Arachis ipaensis]